VGGRDLAELLRNSVAVVFGLQGTRNEGVPPPCSATSRSAALAGETLLVNWLDELLHLQETQRENCGRFDIPSRINTCAPRSKGT